MKQQLRNACDGDNEPKFLIHDNDKKFGQLAQRVSLTREKKTVSCRSSLDLWLFGVMGIRGIATPYSAPNANAHCDRLVGTTRRECTDHMLIWSRRHCYKVLREFYMSWYNGARVHQGRDAVPDDPKRERVPRGERDAPVVAIPFLGGLHREYRYADAA